jgi:hypothetical protein
VDDHEDLLDRIVDLRVRDAEAPDVAPGEAEALVVDLRERRRACPAGLRGLDRCRIERSGEHHPQDGRTRSVP